MTTLLTPVDSTIGICRTICENDSRHDPPATVNTHTPTHSPARAFDLQLRDAMGLLRTCSASVTVKADSLSDLDLESQSRKI